MYTTQESLEYDVSTTEHNCLGKRTLMTAKLVNRLTSMLSLCTSYSSIQSRTVFPALKRE